MALFGLTACVLAFAGCSPADAALAGAASTARATPAIVASDRTGTVTPVATPTATTTPDSDGAVPKVGRPGETATPSVNAARATPADPVVYDDGVRLTITDVAFAEQTSVGPGASTGQEYARIAFELTNGSTQPIDVSTTIVTVIDAQGTRLTPVYVRESGARDFSGTVRPGSATTAVYAVAAPADRDTGLRITVDFDATHVSAFFEGPLN